MSTAIKYRYTVITKAKKTLSGIISAATMDQAAAKLEKLGYKLLSIVPVKEGDTLLSGKKVFSFEATNEQGQKILGTIATKSEESARRKLEKEHGLVVRSVQEMSLQKKTTTHEKSVFEKEATMIIEKAEALLREISPYDEDYNIIFDAKEDVRYALKMGHVKEMEKNILDTLQLLQQKEKASVADKKVEHHEHVVKNTGDVIASIKVETEQVHRSMGNVYLNAVLEELEVLSGWLLSFYALYFVVAEILAVHVFRLSSSVFLENTLQQTLLFKVALSILLIHVYCRVKLYVLENKYLSGILLGVIVILMIAWMCIL